MFAFQVGDAIIAVLDAEAINDAAIDYLRRWSQRAEIGRVEIANRKGANCARPRPCATDLQRLPRHGCFVGFHKRGRPWQARQWTLSEACAPEVPARLAMAINEPVAVSRR